MIKGYDKSICSYNTDKEESGWMGLIMFCSDCMGNDGKKQKSFAKVSSVQSVFLAAW